MNTVVITGAASGLGKAIALHYSEKSCSETNNTAPDYQIIIADIQDQLGQAVVEQINNNGGQAYYCHCDIGKADDFQRLVEFTEQTTGQCNILVNNAGVANATTLMGSTEEEWQRLINLDLMSCVRASKAFTSR